MGAAGSLSAEQERYIDIIKNNADRLSLLVNDLLDISRIEQGRVDLEIRDLRLADIVEELLSALEIRFTDDEKVLRITVDLPDDLPTIQADPAQLQQVFINLLNNAAESIQGDGTITLTTRPADSHWVKVQVSDTGSGIPEENLHRLFTPFFTTKPPGKGTGLGLSIVYGIVKMHRGQITVRSQVGHGTTFVVTLPVRLPQGGLGTGGTSIGEVIG